ncbi:hypothetical protein D9M70_519740 [compost metagenome]
MRRGIEARPPEGAFVEDDTNGLRLGQVEIDEQSVLMTLAIDLPAIPVRTGNRDIYLRRHLAISSFSHRHPSIELC